MDTDGAGQDRGTNGPGPSIHTDHWECVGHNSEVLPGGLAAFQNKLAQIGLAVAKEHTS